MEQGSYCQNRAGGYLMSGAADIPVFQNSSIKAMSPVNQEIAKILESAGYIEIIEKTDPGRVIS
jgi:hypothetical protein